MNEGGGCRGGGAIGGGRGGGGGEKKMGGWAPDIRSVRKGKLRVVGETGGG